MRIPLTHSLNRRLLNSLAVACVLILAGTALGLLAAPDDAPRRNPLPYGLAGALCGSLLGAWLVMRRIARLSRELHSLGQGMAAATVGDRQVQVALAGCSELEALGEGFNHMVAELAAQRDELQVSERGLRTLMNSTPDAIITTSRDGRVLHWNAAAERLFGYRAAQMRGEPLQTVFAGAAQATVSHILAEYRGFRAVRDDQVAGPWELTARHKDGLHKPVELTLRDLRLDGLDGLVLVVRDITERKMATEKLAFLTQHDPLTRLPNRSLLRDLLADAMARADQSERLVGVIAVGLDGFEALDDRLATGQGDALLQGVAERIGDRLARRDGLGRIGHDTFCVVVDAMRHVDEAARLADAITIALALPFELDGAELTAPVSMGVAVYPFDDNSPEQLLERALAALARCRRTGDRNYLFYADDMNVRRAAQRQLASELEQALVAGQFRVHYQAQFDAAGGRLVGVEALLRWQHPERGLLTPGEFISVLEETGLIVPVGNWMLGEVCRQVAEWRRQGHGTVPISLNLSPRQFRSADFLEQVAGRLAGLTEAVRRPAAPGRADYPLAFELTEGVVMRDAQASRVTLDALHELGVHLAVDDFGSGYASLGQLRQFPIDAVKIDQCFVQDIGRSPEAELMVQAVIDLAHSLGLRVIAEGTETGLQLGFLRDKGCDVIQGHVHGPAVPPEALQPLLQQRRQQLH